MHVQTWWLGAVMGGILSVSGIVGSVASAQDVPTKEEYRYFALETTMDALAQRLETILREMGGEEDVLWGQVTGAYGATFTEPPGKIGLLINRSGRLVNGPDTPGMMAACLAEREEDRKALCDRIKQLYQETK